MIFTSKSDHDNNVASITKTASKNREILIRFIKIISLEDAEAATRGVLFKEVFLEMSQNSQENTCTCSSINKETLAQVFSCAFCEISKNAFFTEHLRTTASEEVLSYYETVIRPYMKYSCYVWVGAPNYHSDILENLQRWCVELLTPHLLPLLNL